MKRHNELSTLNKEHDIINPKKSKIDDHGTNHSLVLQSIVSKTVLSGSNPSEQNQSFSVEDFFTMIWQCNPTVYKQVISVESPTTARSCPLQETLAMGWDGVISMLENSRQNYDKINEIEVTLHPLFLQNQTPMQPLEIQKLYSSNPFAAYLDGCSIIQNHAEYFSRTISNLCLDLQKSFPHVYCNTYLTPPNSQAVKAHADDRDVLVIQIKGKKRWKVYRNVPISFPYSHEQVGKNGIPVPSFVTDRISSTETKASEVLIDCILNEGDVLYMPRGYVHEASTSDCDNEPSFHATIAIMTSDWSYAKTVSEIVRKCLDKNAEYRKAIHVDFGRKDLSTIDETVKTQFNQELDSIVNKIKDCVTMEAIASELGKKYDFHNHHSDRTRKIFSLDEVNESVEQIDIVGPNAARLVSFNTRIRASTQEEREMIKSGDRGLKVRENISDALLSIIAQMKDSLETSYRVSELRSLVQHNEGSIEICDFTLCSFVKCCVELGVISIVM